ncbi:MAG: PLDc N-terminal domain-containing protein [Bacteroidota bacterium]
MLDTLIYVLIVLSLILWIWALIDIAGLRFKAPVMKTLWVFAILLFPVLAPLFYFQLKKKFVVEKKIEKCHD